MMDAKAIADKYIVRDGRNPSRAASSNSIVWAPIKIAEKEQNWLSVAVLRGGYMPTRDRDGDGAPHLSELRSMHQRGLVQEMPWRITKFGRDCLAELEATPARREITRTPLVVIPNATALTMAVRPLADIEREAIYAAIGFFKGNKSHAAKALGIAIRTIRNKLRVYEGRSTLERGD